MLHAIIIGLFLATIACSIAWFRVYRLLDPEKRSADPRYRHYQVLTGAIATLVILVSLLIVFSSEPGNPTEHLFWP